VRSSIPVMAHTTCRVTYRGDPALASMLAQMLENEGAMVRWERPLERRDVTEMAPAVVVNMVTEGSLTAIKVAVDKFRKHMHGRAEATIENVELDDNLDQ
jgi:hypothetical protein